MWGPFGWFFGSFIGVVGFLIALVFYFIPTIIALARNHRNKLAIFLVNLFFGLSGIGWIITLIWAIVGK